jgi:hypothetical protein
LTRASQSLSRPDLAGAGEDPLVAAVLHEVGALRLSGAGGHVDDAEQGVGALAV